MRKAKSNPWFGTLPELGGDGRIVVAETEEKAKDALLAAWRSYDKSVGSDYHGQVKTFSDLEEIYGAFVKCVPWNQWTFEKGGN